jgi:large subunit ribosomal protein L25
VILALKMTVTGLYKASSQAKERRMMMFTLNAEKRNMDLKPKQLRREGIIPGVLYGKELPASLSIQFSQSETMRFLQSNAMGSRAEVALGDKKYPALLREIARKPATGQVEHLSFQTLVAGEVVTSTARIVLINRDKVSGMIQQPQGEISYQALPSHLVDRIEIDLDGVKVGDSIRVSDLEIAKNPHVEILTAPDTLLVAIADSRRQAKTDDEAEEEGIEAEGE